MPFEELTLGTPKIFIWTFIIIKSISVLYSVLSDIKFPDQLTSKLIFISVKNFMQEELDYLIENLVKNVRDKLIKQSKNPDAFKEKIMEMKTKLKSEYKKSLDAESANILEQISKCMNIPDHVLLKEDLPIKPFIKANISDIVNEVDELKGKFKALKYLKKKIHDEIKIADSLIFILDSIITENDIDFKLLNTDEILSFAKSNLELAQ